MKLRFILPIILILNLFIQACKQRHSVPPQAIEISDTADYAVANWKFIGPFYSDSINFDTILNYDNLKAFGLSELNADARDLGQLTTPQPLSYFYTPDTFEQAYRNLYGMIELDGIVDMQKSGVMYATCILESKKEQDVVFLTGGDESCQFILNGKMHPLLVKNTHRLVFQNYLFAKLKKGKNLIVVKIPNTHKAWAPNEGEPWRFILNYCSPRRYNSYWLQLEKMLIRNPIVPFQKALRIEAPIHPIDTICTVEIRNTADQLVYKSSELGDISLNNQDCGLYRLEVQTNRESYWQNFYYGDVHQGFREYIPKARQAIDRLGTSSSALNIAALLDRYAILLNYYKSQDYLEVSESLDGVHYNPLDSLILKTSRLVSLHQPKQVKLSGLQTTNSLLNKVEFYKHQADSIIQLNYLQTSNIGDLDTLQPTHQTLIQSEWNPWLTKDYHYAFPENQRPDFVSIPTDFEIDQYKELREPSYFIFENREIERRFVFLYHELQQIISDLEIGKEAFKNKPGTHLRAFISDIEEQKQYYVVQSPESVASDTQAKPLIVIVPWVSYERIPFLRSSIVADIHIHEMYQWQADLQDFIIVHANARTFEKAVTHPIAIKNIFNTIEAVKQNYAVDTTRIHLFAYCGGSELATMMVSKYPHKFASLGIVGGYAMTTSNKWMYNNYSINFTENLTNTPVYIIHGELDSHTPVEPIKNFVEIARQNGNSQIHFEIEPELTFEAYPRLRHQEQMFKFFKSNQLTIPAEIKYATAQYATNRAYWLQLFPKESGVKASIHAKANGNTMNIQAENAGKINLQTSQAPIATNEALTVKLNGEESVFAPPLPHTITLELGGNSDSSIVKKNRYTEGPVLNVFGDKFLLVTSTAGSHTQNEQANRIAYEFASMWKEEYFVSPRIKKDTEVSDEDLKNSNLVVFGNQHTNHLFKRLYAQLPIQITKNRISLAGKDYSGEALVYYFTNPNPLNPKKHILLIGGNNMRYAQLRKGNPAQNGYYDYEIYTCDSLDQYIKDQGYFNEYWMLK